MRLLVILALLSALLLWMKQSQCKLEPLVKKLSTVLHSVKSVESKEAEDPEHCTSENVDLLVRALLCNKTYAQPLFELFSEQCGLDLDESGGEDLPVE